MPVRNVEWKRLWKWGDAITVDNENRVIRLNLRDENNLIIYDALDDEIYVDLQLPAWIEPTDAFPVGVTTGRVLVADWWDVTGTLICAKTTSGDMIKLLYADDGKLYIDNWTWTFKQIIFKTDIENLLKWYVKLGLNKVFDDDTVVEIGRWSEIPGWEWSGHHVAIDPKGKVEIYNVTTAWKRSVELDENWIFMDDTTAMGWDMTFQMDYEKIVAEDRLGNSQRYDFHGDTRIARLNDIVALVDSSAPQNPLTGQLWYDTANSVLKLYDGTARQTI